MVDAHPATGSPKIRRRTTTKIRQRKETRVIQMPNQEAMLNGVCETMDGPYTFGTYLWAKFNHLDAWERKLVEGPYIHHMAEVEGDVTATLREFIKYVPELTSDTVE